MTRRRNVLAAAGVAVLATLSGCTVPIAGAMGITVDADGRPMGVLMVCHDHIDGATLYTDSKPDDPDDSESVEVGSWSGDESVKGFATWSLDTAGDGWSVDEPLQPLKENREYHLYGWTRGNSWSTGNVNFTPADLAALTPGQVRYRRSGGDDHRTGSVEDFRTEACKDR
ncbi:hypothetical protein HLK59_47995 [Streptomyces sp. S3(2020)]|uniref:hypothetical protein n=1 Tax=Streptomyces sp. S3(2020) TaxID=2732044 RepID=UPI001489009C|nr:hypothetical protein [Streptomyces sp. S3(2020)]NNN37930.1 hypothetical protein [Streptomyces sp. S3(2020)]